MMNKKHIFLFLCCITSCIYSMESSLCPSIFDEEPKAVKELTECERKERIQALVEFYNQDLKKLDELEAITFSLKKDLNNLFASKGVYFPGLEKRKTETVLVVTQTIIDSCPIEKAKKGRRKSI